MRLSRPSFSQSLATTGLALALSCTTLAAFAGNDHNQATPHAVAEQARQQASDHTQALAALQKRWAKARGAEKSRALQQMIAKAEERRTFLLELMETSPSQVLQAVLPDEQHAGMPAEVQALLEQKLELEGEYEAIYEEDFEAGTARLHQFVKTPFGERFELHSNGKGAAALTGQQVQLQGLLFPQENDADGTSGELLLDDSGILVMGATGGDNGGTAGPLPNTFGERKVAVIMINFQDLQDKPWTASQMHDMFFNQVSDFYMENSYNQTWLNGDVLGWYTLPLNGASSCPADFDDTADAIAEASGVDLAAYSHRVYLIPPTSACARNSSTVGGSPSRTWISSADNLRIVSHEFGHVLGLGHARALDCEGAVLETNCKDVNYGDIHDVMGKNFGHLNAFHKEKLGWLGYDQSPPVTEVTADGSYTISPLSADGSTPKALKIWKGVDSSTGKDSWYFLEFRRPIGYDTDLFEPTSYNNPEQLANGTVIHSGVDAAHNGHMLDMTPDSASSTAYDLQDPALEIGYSYHDDIAGITITPLSANASGLTVDISFENGSSSGGNGGSGGNNDTTNNAPVAYNDSASTAVETPVIIDVLGNDLDPDGNSLSVTSLSGVNGSATINGDGSVTYTPPADFSGTENFNYSISDGKGGSDSASVSVSVIAATSNKAPVALDDSATTAKSAAVIIAVLDNDHDPDGDSLSITGVTQGAKGSVQINSNGTLTFTPAKNFKNSDSFSYTISDGKMSASATVNVSLSAADDSSGSGNGNGKGPNK